MASFSMFAGDTKVLQVDVIDENGDQLPITGNLIRWQLASKVTDDPALIEKSVGSGITIIDGPHGRFNVLLDPEDTLTLSGKYYFEAEIDDGGIISTILTGDAEIKPALIDPVAITAATRRKQMRAI